MFLSISIFIILTAVLSRLFFKFMIIAPTIAIILYLAVSQETRAKLDSYANPEYIGKVINSLLKVSQNAAKEVTKNIDSLK